MTQVLRTKVAIIGSGPAGYTAAIYAARANLQPILFLGSAPGGLLMLTQEVENYPGFTTILGPELMASMRKQVEELGVHTIAADVKEVDFSKNPFVCIQNAETQVLAETVVVATGAKVRLLGVPGEQEFFGYGVSSCATCDGFFFKNKKVAVVGGGNSAVEEALFLSKIAEKVYLIHRRDALRASAILQDRLLATDNIEILWDTTVASVHGLESPKSVTHLLLNTKNGETKLDVSALFVAIGHDPNTQMFNGQLALDEYGYVLVRSGKTGASIPGVFLAGDVQDSIFRQAITAAATGCMAALEVERFLNHQG